MKNLLIALRHPHDYRWLALRPWRRHSLVLSLGGLIYVGLGLVYMLTDSTPNRLASLQLAVNLAPFRVWGAAFFLIGVLGILSGRWPPASEKWGYTALSSIAALWGSFFWLGVVFLDAPSTGLSAALIWYLLALLWWAVSGLDNPHDRVQDE